MLNWFSRNAELRLKGQNLYERIVAQARLPEFYSVAKVPDTMEGRFEMIVLHIFLVLDRLKGEGTTGQKLGQHVMEHFVSDMDDAMRQIGIGDMGVPRRIQRVAAAMRERIHDYASAFDESGHSAQLAAMAYIFQGQPPNGCSEKLAAYVRAARKDLAVQASDQVRTGRISFPKPEPYLTG